MSVTTSTRDDVSFEVHSYARDDEKIPEPGYKAARASRPRILQRLLTLMPPVALGLFLLVSWYMGTTYGLINGLILPTPADFFASLVNGLTSGLLLNSAMVTAQESLLGFLMALVIALPLGYALAKSHLVAAAVQPYLAAGQAIPAIIVASLLVYWLGAGLLPI